MNDVVWPRVLVGAALLLVALSASGQGAAPQAAAPADTQAASASPIAPADSAVHSTRWALRVPKHTAVTYKGAVNFDAAGGGTGTVLYPAPNLIGLIAAVATHAALSGAAQSAEKDRLTKQADQVLEPYRSTIDGMTQADVVRNALSYSSLGSERRLIQQDEAASDWVVAATPVFIMTQDQRSLVVENYVRVLPPAGSAGKPYENVVRVISRPIDATEPTRHWLEQDGAVLKQKTAILLSHSVELALAEAVNGRGPENAPHRTVRYSEGNEQRMERGQPLFDMCGRTVLRTLRGWLMSVPRRATPDSEPCLDPIGDRG